MSQKKECKGGKNCEPNKSCVEDEGNHKLTILLEKFSLFYIVILNFSSRILSMTFSYRSNEWALILGGSSGFGLATAKKLSQHGMNICVVHRDRKGAMDRIAQEFAEIQGKAPQFLS